MHFVSMDREHVIFAAGVTIAVAIGSFILWGPYSSARSKKRGTVIGLQNLGLTCYLNSLLQALSSCHYFIEWLNNQKCEGDVAKAMKELLNILSGNIDLPLDQVFVSPIEVIHALNHAGWKISNSQQDVHELLCNLINIMEEEAYRASSDFNIGQEVIHFHGLNNLVSSSHSRRQVTTYRSLPNVSSCSDELNESNTSHEDDLNILHNNGSSSSLNHKCPNGCAVLPSASNNCLQNNNASIVKRTRSRLSQDVSQNPKPSPFRGYSINRIECTKCDYKSVIRYDNFDIISLHLPELTVEPVIFNLVQLLENYIKHEMINDITCDGCNNNRSPTEEPIASPAIKLIRFAKLPPSLCLHIVRTSFHEFGVYKRQDYVDFPEYLVMDPYVYKPTRHNSFTADQTLLNLWMQGVNSHDADEGVAPNKQKINQKYVYKLKSVIVHRGSHNDGHFMTYRRGLCSQGNRSNENRWYLVSDIDVKETTLFNVLNSLAYVLFYEKCSNLN